LINRLEELVLSGRIDEAINYVSEMNARHISSLLQPDTMEQAPEKFDLFIRRLYASIDSSYAKADLMHHLRGIYLDVLSHLDSTSFALRDLSLETLSEVVRQVADDIEIQDTLTGGPDRVIPPAAYERFRGYAEQLRAMSFQPTPEESATHEQAVTEDLGRTGKEPSGWLELYRTNQLTILEPPRLPDTAGIPVSKLEELVLSDRIDEALSCVSELNAQHISSLLRYEAMEQAPEKFDLFIRRHYASLKSPYAKADAVYNLAGSYITSLSFATNAFFAERDLSLDALTVVAERMIEDIRIQDTLVGCPDKVLPPATYERLLGYADQLKAMSFLPTPEESTQHEQEITAWLESIGEDPDSWLDMYRTSQLRPIPES
jgi:hypothetical protein